MNITDKSYKIHTMQLSFIVLSLVFSLVSNSYKLSVKLCFGCACALDVHFK